MSNKNQSNLRSISDRNIAIAKQKGRVPQKRAETYTVEGDAPPAKPRAGTVVEFCFADSNLIGSQIVNLGMVISTVPKNTPDGRVNGWMILDPTAAVQGPQGQPMQAPPLLPILNSPYSKERKPLTWRFFEDADEADALALQGHSFDAVSAL